MFAAGDCVISHHRLLDTTWLPLGTTAHKLGRVAGENAIMSKHDLVARPIYHHKCESIEAHLSIVFAALAR